MIETDLWVLFVAGLLGGGHCVGMCSGIVTALTLNLPSHHRRWLIMLLYNSGRLTSYTVIGLLLGGLAHTSSHMLPTHPLQVTLFALSNIILILMGLYLAGLSSATTTLESLGRPIWQRLQPLVKRVVPISRLQDAFVAGLLWGWLPCGLVYSASISALASGSAPRGGMVMLAFGLGTLPNLLLMGVFADALRQWIQRRPVRLTAGLVVVALGGYRLVQMVMG